MAAGAWCLVVCSGWGQGLRVSNLTTFHRSGQTFLTWDECGAVAGESYRVYRHTAPIDAATLPAAAALARVAEGSAWHAREGANFIIEDLAPPLPSARGLFVNTVHDTGSWHYAVTVTTNGVENTNDFDAGNATAAPVTEQEADPLPVCIRTNGRTRVYTQFMDYGAWNPTLNGYAYNYSVSTASDVSTNAPAPLFLRLHEFGNRYSVPSEPSWGKGIEISADDPNNTWHYGFSASWNYAAGGTPSTGPIVNFTEQRHLRAIHDVIRDPAYNVDTNRIYVWGSSMGGSGALSMGLRYPHVFAAAFCWLPMTDYRAAATGNWAWDLVPKWGAVTSNLPVENRGPDAGPLAAADGTGVYDWMSHPLQVTNRSALASAYIFFHHGTADTTIAWPQQGADLPLAMYRGRAGFHAMVDGSGHVGLGYLDPVTNATPNWHPKLADFRKDRSFPAFGWSDGNPPLPPVAGSRYNFDLEWSCPWNNFAGDIVDTATQYVLTVRSRTTDQRVSIAPRRLQAFAAEAGRRVLWRNLPVGSTNAVQCGVVFADAAGWIGVSNFLVTAAGNRLAFDIDDPADADGDGVPDYWERAFGFNAGSSGDGGATDTDGDGAGNAAEYAAGTSPRDPDSVLRIVSFDASALIWESTPGFRYRLAEAAVPGAWTSLGAAITAATSRTTWIPTDTPAAGRFLTVEVQR